MFSPTAALYYLMQVVSDLWMGERGADDSPPDEGHADGGRGVESAVPHVAIEMEPLLPLTPPEAPRQPVESLPPTHPEAQPEPVIDSVDDIPLNTDSPTLDHLRYTEPPRPEEYNLTCLTRFRLLFRKFCSATYQEICERKWKKDAIVVLLLFTIAWMMIFNSPLLLFLLIVIALFVLVSFGILRRWMGVGKEVKCWAHTAAFINLAEPHLSFAKIRRTMGEIFRIALPRPVLVICGVRPLMDMRLHAVIKDRPNDYRWILFQKDPSCPVGITLANGEPWTKARGHLASFLNDSEQGITTIMESGKELVKLFEQVAANDGIIDPKEPLSYIVARVIYKVLFSIDLSFADQAWRYMRDSINIIMRTVTSLGVTIAENVRELRGCFQAERHYRTAGNGLTEEFCNLMVEAGAEDERDNAFLAREDRRQGATCPIRHDLRHRWLTNVLDIDLKVNDGYDREYLERLLRHISADDLLITLGDAWVGGMETTVTAMLWGLLYLARDQDWQQQIHEELVEFFRHGSEVDFAKHKETPLTLATMWEILRLADVLPLGIPHKFTEDYEWEGVTIKKGETAFLSYGTIHHDPLLFPDPETFRPSRFINEEGKAVAPEFLLPFGFGPRRCPGEALARREIYVFLAILLLRIKFSFVDDEKPPSFKRTAGMTSPPPPYKLRVSLRPKPEAPAPPSSPSVS